MEALRAIINSPELELVGVWEYLESKTGMDAGELCGLPPTGIKATRSLEEILAIKADCVSYMPRIPYLDEVCALLESGKNVICTPFMHYAEALPAGDREKIREACQKGNASLYGTGINPGFAGMLLPVVMSGMSRRIDRVTIYEKGNWSHYSNARITFENVRFGSKPEVATLESNDYARFLSSIFQEQIYMLAAAWRVSLEKVVTEQDLIAADKSFDIMSGRIDKGTVCGQRYHWMGYAGNKPIIDIDALWTVGAHYPGHWPNPGEGWSVNIEGDPSMRAQFMCAASLDRKKPVTLADHVHATEIATAMLVINSISAVCEAPAGIRGAYELPMARPISAFQV
jgi:hypothetical protein